MTDFSFTAPAFPQVKTRQGTEANFYSLASLRTEAFLDYEINLRPTPITFTFLIFKIQITKNVS